MLGGDFLRGHRQEVIRLLRHVERRASAEHPLQRIMDVEDNGDAAVIRKSFDDFKKSGFHFQELMVSLLRWSIFPPES